MEGQDEHVSITDHSVWKVSALREKQSREEVEDSPSSSSLILLLFVLFVPFLKTKNLVCPLQKVVMSPKDLHMC